uniref:Leucine-rich repeat-containing N-terminal plant-type domain-containing protein n=1 Tax=Lactuca sativa TaxID=4236 RepID=A0A9R1USE5_LACSA|nr:hypothetical protein LSAT_V11C800445380 [Lactuca sativa]
MGNHRGLGLHLIFVSIFLVANTCSCLGVENTSIVCIEQERLALLKFKESVIDYYGMLLSWVGNDCCMWERVHCDNVTGNIKSLHLKGDMRGDIVGVMYYLVGDGMSFSLAELSHLSYLDLSGNDFGGSRIPKFIGSFKHLTYLNLSHAGFQGIISHHIGNLSNLKVLDLSSNDGLKADDMAWTFRLSSLEHLDLSNVDLGGAKNRGMSLSMIPLLKELSLSGCGLSNADFAPFLNSSRILSNIKYLDLSRNYFKGPLPGFFLNMTSLVFLDLGLNFFEGPLPGFFQNLKSLAFLDLSGFDLSLTWNFASLLNTIPSLSELHLSRCGLHNTLLSPPYLNSSTLSNIRHLDLSSNSIGGVFPSYLKNMSSLRVLDLSENSLTSLDSNMPNLLELDLSSNKFKQFEHVGIWRHCHLKKFSVSNNYFTIEISDTSKNGSECSEYALERLEIVMSLHGRIPEAVGRLANLREIDLSFNGLTGPIPKSLRKLIFLEVLDLSYNALTGPIPTFIGNLTTLQLSFNQLNGSIPESFGNLSALTYLDLRFNRLTGPIPTSLGRLVSLQQVMLFSNMLNGSIPESFGNLSALTYLDLHFNRLTGPIPASLGRLVSLQEIILSFNELSGSIPESFGKLPALIYLNLRSNQLTGPIPASLGGLVTVQAIWLSSNMLNGTIPVSIGQLAKLQYLDLSSNSLEGVVFEDHFANLSMLKQLDISSNIRLAFNVSREWIPSFQLVSLQLSSCNIGNEFPQWLRYQRKLARLALSNTTISGPLPTWLQKMPIIPFLDLSHNKLKGPLTNLPNGGNVNVNRYDYMSMFLENYLFTESIPRSQVMKNDIFTASIRRSLFLENNLFIGSIPKSLCRRTHLEYLDLSRNRLTGKIPKCLGNLQELHTMIFSSNHLSGVVPSSLGLCSSLYRLKLNGNNFTGEPPSELWNLQNLEVLDLGNNIFCGSIPEWNGESLTNLMVLRLHKNNFTGRIPQSLCKSSNLQILDVAYNNLMGSIPDCLGELYAMLSGNTGLDYRRSADNVIQVLNGVDREYTKTWDLLFNMDLSSNKLSGEIPIKLTALAMLMGLNLSNNHLSGSIPYNIGNMKKLFSLDLSGNKLTGMIPASMAALTFLSHLNLSHNNLSGPIPTGNQLQTLDDPSIYTGNKDLCGAPLPNNCSVHEDPTTTRQKKHEAVDELENEWLFYVDIMSGFVTGFWGVIGVLLFKKEWRWKLFRFAEETMDKINVAFMIRVAMMKRGR